MLAYLHVKNIALIKEIEIEFKPGLTVITGETGAGKSILVGSINAVLGNQLSKDFIRVGEDYALIELVFEQMPLAVNELLEHLGVETLSQLIISRKLSDRSVFRVNGQIVGAQNVKRLADCLIDIHSQHQHQSLLDEKQHILLLDRFLESQIASTLSKHQVLYQQYLNLKKTEHGTNRPISERQREIDFLEFEIQEIESLSIDPLADEDLEKKYRNLQQSVHHIQMLNQVYDYIHGSDQGEGAVDYVEQAMRVLVGLKDTELSSDLASQLENIRIGLEDFAHTLLGHKEDLETDSNVLKEMGERVDALNRLRMKYGNTLSNVLEVLEQKKALYQELIDFEHHQQTLQAKLDAIKEDLKSTSMALTKMRTKGAKTIENLIEVQLQALNLKDAVFSIHVLSKGKIGLDGQDHVQFMMSANKGQPVKPLVDIASGGEISRVMLAIKSVLAKADDIGTMIFDEIDVGISGMTAQKVAEKLYEVSQSKQVITISHLPQIAAMAQQHVRIQKISTDDVLVDLKELDEDESIEELSRLLSGHAITEAVRDNAKELKNHGHHLKLKASPLNTSS